MNKFFAIIFCYFFVHSVYAEENCPALQANIHSASGAYVFKQFTFENVQDLVIIEPQSQVHRVTFGRGDASKVCSFRPLAFVQGSEGEKYWGWHMLWTEPSGLYYARIDGEAWVSSSPKVLSKFTPINPQFKLSSQYISITWQQVENNVITNMQALSGDEGRSWEFSKPAP